MFSAQNIAWSYRKPIYLTSAALSVARLVRKPLSFCVKALLLAQWSFTPPDKDDITTTFALQMERGEL
jgi:hypothetical protein